MRFLVFQTRLHSGLPLIRLYFSFILDDSGQKRLKSGIIGRKMLEGNETKMKEGTETNGSKYKMDGKGKGS